MKASRRFVRILVDSDPKADPGSRIRVDYDPDDTGAFSVTDENVLPEKVLDPNCIRVENLACVNLDNGSARWLRDAMIALCAHLDALESAKAGSGR